jgi:hypothetical protein
MCVNVHTIVGRLRETGDEVEAMALSFQMVRMDLKRKKSIFLLTD